jgi:hypothetical protein
MTEPDREYRTARWVLVVLAASAAGSLVLATFLLRGLGSSATAWTLFGLGLLFLLGFAEGLMSRVLLAADRLEIVANFRKTVIPRSELVRAVAEKGCPVVVELRSGGWIKLPTALTGPHPNTLRAWITRGAPADERARDGTGSTTGS